MKMPLIKLSKWKIIKKARGRWGKGEQIHNVKKKYSRKYANPKIDSHRFIEGTVNDYEDEN